ncbi:MAG TPA: TatD family hydrolase [Candidatus Nanopelagicaceae bacterium]|nr:TatD family hydrolase [Candidatus Nanopelagicaceae bacterium]
MVQILIDVHCHINLYLTIDKVIKNARDVGVEKIIAVAMSSLSQERVLEIARQYNEVFASLGIHPEEVKMNEKIEQQLDSIIKLIKNNKQDICAIGEIGLDHFFVKDKELYPLQKTIFNKMLLLAQDLELPVNLHTKGAEKIVFDTLPSYKIPNINIHWYSGPEKFIKLGMDRGYYFSITPAINYSPAVKNVVLNVDREHLLLESDGPVKYSGKVSVPAMVKNVLNSISKLKEINSDELENQIEVNTRKIFPKIF